MSNSQNATDPIAVTRDTSQSIGVSTTDMRWDLAPLAPAAQGTVVNSRSGVFPGGTSGAGVPARLQVVASSGLQASVNAGNYAVDRGSFGVYLGAFTGTTTVGFNNSNPSNPRIDYVVIRTRDPGVDASVTETAKIIVLAGTPAAVPTEPSVQLTSGDLLLAAVTIRANTSSVIASDISDRRPFIATRGGIPPTQFGSNAAGAYEGEYRDNTSTDGLERWSGSVWQVVASPAAWTSFTPVLASSGGGDCNLGASGVRTGAYQLLGKTLRVRYYFQAVRPCNLGWGSVYTRLPAGLYSAAGIADHHGRCQLNTQSGGQYLTWIGDAGVFSNSNLVYPTFNKTITDNTFANYQVAATSAAAGTGVPLIAGEYPDPLRGLGIHIELEIQ